VRSGFIGPVIHEEVLCIENKNPFTVASNSFSSSATYWRQPNTPACAKNSIDLPW
jgi:hypothetical protein